MSSYSVGKVTVVWCAEQLLTQSQHFSFLVFVRVQLLCSPARQLVTWISFKESGLLAVTSLCAQMPHSVLGVYVCCRSLVLYSLCHTEYWLGGRWLNGSCLALLMLFIFSCIVIFIYSHLLFASRGHSVALFALLHTSNPLTSADNVNCLPLAGDTCCISSNTFTVFLSPPSS